MTAVTYALRNTSNPHQVICKSGNVYNPDSLGRITVYSEDIAECQAAGYFPVASDGGAVESVTGNIVDEEDPNNPVVTQENADWREEDEESPKFIENKPSNVVQSVSGNIVDAGDPENPTVTQIQPNWNQDNPEATDYIANKPNLLVRPNRVVTASGAITVTNADFFVGINKTVGASSDVEIPNAGANAGQDYVIKDMKRDAATNNITITPGTGTIEGLATYVIATNGDSVTLHDNGTSDYSII